MREKTFYFLVNQFGQFMTEIDNGNYWSDNLNAARGFTSKNEAIEVNELFGNEYKIKKVKI